MEIIYCRFQISTFPNFQIDYFYAMKWLTNLFTSQKPIDNTDLMKKFLIVGLGNIGAEYVNTRHNIGFKILDFLARKEAIDFETVKLGSLAENTQNYTRFRFGISDEFKKGQQVNYVLGDWDEAEKAKLPERLELASEIIKSFGTAGIENTMSNFNGK